MCVCVLAEGGGGPLQLSYDMEVSLKAGRQRGGSDREGGTIAILGPRAVSGLYIRLLPVAVGGGVGIEITL